jgi:hypothetical protein
MHRAFWCSTDAGAYWSVVDEESYEAVELADRFLQYFRFGRGRAESTTRKCAESSRAVLQLLFGTISQLD